METPGIGRLCVITDVTVQARFDHITLADLACRGGADIIQFRDKTLHDAEFLEIARRIRRVCDRHGALFIVNDRVGAARDAGADGVHLGRGDATVVMARELLGDRAVIGATAHSLSEAIEAERSGANYLGFGHIFPTSSKARETPPVGLDALAVVCASVSIPVIAIGGITSERVADVMRAGAWGVAVIAEVCAAEEPRMATLRLRRAVDESLPGDRR